MSEEIIGTICGLTGHTYDIVYDLLFTSERVICVLIQHPADVPPYQSSYGWQNILIGNWNSKRKEKIKQGELVQKRQDEFDQVGEKITPDQLLKSHKFNVELRYEDIVSVQVKKGIFDTHLKFDMNYNGARKSQRKFGVPRNKLSFTREMIEQVLSDKVKK